MLRSVEAKSHSQTVVENFNTSALDFYKTVEEAVAKRQIPEVTLERTDLHEGGVLSAKREYLLIKRGRYIFAVCSAPFGKGQFFSWWLLERLPRFGLLIVLGVLVLVPILLVGMMASLGIVKGFVWFIIIVAGALWGIQQGMLGEPGELDATLVAVPYLGTVYQRLFRPATFYAEDTRAMFLESMRHAVKEAVDEVCTAQGRRALAPEPAVPAGNGQ